MRGVDRGAAQLVAQQPRAGPSRWLRFWARFSLRSAGEGEPQPEVLGIEPEGELEQLDRLVVALPVGEPPGERDELFHVGRAGRTVGHRALGGGVPCDGRGSVA